MTGFSLPTVRLFRALFLITLSALAACGDSEEGGGPKPVGALGIDDGASRGESRVALVRVDRDVSLALSTGASVLVPAGAVTRGLTIGMKRPSDEEALGLVASIGRRKIVSAPYVVTPHGTQFEKDVKLTLPVANAAPGKRLQVAWLENEQDKNWKVLGPATAVDKKVVVPIKHFSVLVLVEEDEQQPVEADAGRDAAADAGAALGEASVRPAEGGSQAEAGLPAVDARVEDVPVDTKVDSGVGGAIDGGATMTPDATLDATVSVSVDGSVSSGYEAELLTRLRRCGMVSREGEFNFEPIVDEPGDRCELDCLLTISCASLSEQFCGLSDNDEMTQCWAGCMGYRTVSCPQEPTLAISCDGYVQCLDGSDESQCPANSYFVCASGEQVAASDRCDAISQCYDGTDELGCNYDSSFFACGDGLHVPLNEQCDGYNDCSDGSDELSCDGRIFVCNDGERTHIESVCNGFAECADASDEPDQCLELLCNPR